MVLRAPDRRFRGHKLPNTEEDVIINLNAHANPRVSYEPPVSALTFFKVLSTMGPNFVGGLQWLKWASEDSELWGPC